MDIYRIFIYIENFILNKCFAVISLILKLKTAGIYAQSLTEIQDLIKPNSTENCETKLFQNFLGLFIFLRLLQVFHDRMNPDCDDRVWLSKSDKNIGAGGWWVGNIFEAAYSGDVLAHPRITIVNTHPEQWAAIYAAVPDALWVWFNILWLS